MKLGSVRLAVLLAAAVPAAAQDSGIAGAVNDNTGGVLPGVTVEAASPALIEGSRVAVTDAQGRYARSRRCDPASTPSPSPSAGSPRWSARASS